MCGTALFAASRPGSDVLQKNVLFSGTIRENLHWGNPEASDEELWEACRMACADEFVSSFPGGLDTLLEEGGRIFPEARSSGCALPERF